MRIRRIVVSGFGALSGISLDWPKDQMLMVIDRNESGKSTLCEAIVTALFGLTRAASLLAPGAKLKDMRRPRKGGPFSAGLLVEAEGTVFQIERDIETGSLSVFDADRKIDRTPEFFRAKSREMLGERLTGLSESLFRSTAYVGQTVLNRDTFDSMLAMELSRIADSGGGEGTVLRAHRAIEAVRAKMFDSLLGASLSVDTEVMRATRRVDELRSTVLKRKRALEDASRLAEQLRELRRKDLESKKRLAVSEAVLVAAEEHLVQQQLTRLRNSRERLADLTQERDRLAKSAAVLNPGLFAQIEKVRQERGRRPEALEEERKRQDADRRALEVEKRDRERRFGLAARLTDTDRKSAVALLNLVIDSEAEASRAEKELETHWEELKRQGLADDLKKFDGLTADDREFLDTAEVRRTHLEKEGLRLDRMAAEAATRVTVAAKERNLKLQSARGLLVASALFAVVWVSMLTGVWKVPQPVKPAMLAVAAALGTSGLFFLSRAARFRKDEEIREQESEKEYRAEAIRTRKELSELRLRLAQLSQQARFAAPADLTRAFRRLKAGEALRQQLSEINARRLAALERRKKLEVEIVPFRAALGSATGLPSAGDCRRALDLLEDMDRAQRQLETKLSVLEKEEQRLVEEARKISEIEDRIRGLAAKGSFSMGGPFTEVLAFLDSENQNAKRYQEIVENSLPAACEAVGRAEDIEKLEADARSLRSDLLSRLGAMAMDERSLPTVPPLEMARRQLEESRLEAERLAAECSETLRLLGARLSDGMERAREDFENLEDAEIVLERAILFRQGLDLARDRMAAAASVVHRDFRKGLCDASKKVLSAWGLPYESLDFDENLVVTARALDGRVLPRAEFEASLSVGAREQLSLAARLAVIDYLGVGSRSLPLLLDDPFANADDDRFFAIMRFLVEKVLPTRPILVVSCHGLRHEQFLSRLPEELAGRVKVASLSKREPHLAD